MALLELNKVNKYFGGLVAVRDLNLELNRGELLGLIGPNGAGKTTVFNMISGVFSPSKGEINFREHNISRYKPHRITRLGIARTFQITTIFGNLTVLQNVKIGGFNRTGLGIGFIDTFVARQKKRDELEEAALEITELVGLYEFKNELARNLPHGRQQAIGLAIALATEPEVLLLDEPVSGMSTEETTWFMEVINSLRKDGKIGILLVEHNVKAVMNYCDRICVLNFGSKIAEGLPSEIKENEEVIKAYLGVEGYAT